MKMLAGLRRLKERVQDGWASAYRAPALETEELITAEDRVQQLKRIPKPLKAELNNLFCYVDKDRSGTITSEEFECLFAELGIGTTRSDMEHIFEVYVVHTVSYYPLLVCHVMSVCLSHMMFLITVMSPIQCMRINENVHNVKDKPKNSDIRQLSYIFPYIICCCTCNVVHHNIIF